MEQCWRLKKCLDSRDTLKTLDFNSLVVSLVICVSYLK